MDWLDEIKQEVRLLSFTRAIPEMTELEYRLVSQVIPRLVARLEAAEIVADWVHEWFGPQRPGTGGREILGKLAAWEKTRKDAWNKITKSQEGKE